MKKATISLAFVAGAFGTDCSAGFKHKKDLTNAFCKTSATTASANGADNCNTNCCVTDDKTCGGAVFACANTDHYKIGDGVALTQAALDAYKSTSTTAKDAGTTCCTPKATCGGGGYECAPGKSKNGGAAVTTDWSEKKCDSNAASCKNSADCCKADATKCEGAQADANIDCATPGLAKPTTDDGWKNTKIGGTQSAADKQAACCVQKVTCQSLMATNWKCPAGKKFKSTIKATGSDDASAGAEAACCDKDEDTCGGANPAAVCSSDRYTDTSLNGRAIVSAATATNEGITASTAAQKASRCCSPKATCADATCPSGYIAKNTTLKSKCPGNAASCVATVAARDTCCAKDTTKCGGLAKPACAAGTFYEPDTWQDKDVPNAAGEITVVKTPQSVKDAWNNKAAAAANLTLCCTPQAACTNVTSATATAAATTTPAPVVTTTPAAAPALKFSQHKIATEKSSGQNNLVWLGVGGVVGMGVLMIVQGVRSRKPSASNGALE